MVVRDYTVDLLCYGLKLMLPGVLRYESGIELNDEVVLITTKGEVIAIAIAQMSTVELFSCDHDISVKLKQCIIERDIYTCRKGLGPVSLEKKKIKFTGLLDKFGRPLGDTPSSWIKSYIDYGATLNTSPDPSSVYTLISKVKTSSNMQIGGHLGSQLDEFNTASNKRKIHDTEGKPMKKEKLHGLVKTAQSEEGSLELMVSGLRENGFQHSGGPINRPNRKNGSFVYDARSRQNDLKIKVEPR